mmetsp:Transcript_38871/g.49628  ORF Transcript_38871/g.49628 Transcript_38871/m.49628 type:complete len:119 (-) Transcript_38871:353-709(-)
MLKKVRKYLSLKNTSESITEAVGSNEETKVLDATETAKLDRFLKYRNLPAATFTQKRPKALNAAVTAKPDRFLNNKHLSAGTFTKPRPKLKTRLHSRGRRPVKVFPTIQEVDGKEISG